LQQIRVQRLFCKKLRTAGVQLKFIQGLAYENFKTSRTKTQMAINNRTVSFQREPIIFFRSPNQKNGCPTMHRHYSYNNSHFIICITAWLSLAIRSQRKKAEGGGIFGLKRGRKTRKRKGRTEGRRKSHERQGGETKKNQ